MVPFTSGLTVQEFTDCTNNASGVTPTGQGPLTGPPAATSTVYNQVHFPASSSHTLEDTHCKMSETLSYMTFLTCSIPEENFKNIMQV